MEITEFLRARLNEDEAAARACLSREPGYPNGVRGGHWDAIDPDEGTPKAGRFGQVPTVGMTITAWPDHATHIARHDPARVLREIPAKRRIIEAAAEATSLDIQVDQEFACAPRDEVRYPYVGDVILRALAAPYADHPDHRPEWAL